MIGVAGGTRRRAREYTYGAGFPEPRAGFAPNLWLREEVLAWFAGQQPKPRCRGKNANAKGTTSTATVARIAPRPADTRPVSSPSAAARPAATPKPYKPKRK